MMNPNYFSAALDSIKDNNSDFEDVLAKTTPSPRVDLASTLAAV